MGVLGVAGGNGLDLIDPSSIDTVYGYDLNPAYLEACEARFRGAFGDRLHLVEEQINRSTSIERVGLLIANLIVEYIGLDEFAAFAAANIDAIEVLSCVVQSSYDVGFVSESPDASAFDVLASVASNIDPDDLTEALAAVGFEFTERFEYHLPNGKRFVRVDLSAGQSPAA